MADAGGGVRRADGRAAPGGRGMIPRNRQSDEVAYLVKAPGRRSRWIFARLVMLATGSSNPCRGSVDSATGEIRFHNRGNPRPAPKSAPVCGKCERSTP